MGIKCSAADVRVTVVLCLPVVRGELPLPPACRPSLSSLPQLYLLIYLNKKSALLRAGHGAGLKD